MSTLLGGEGSGDNEQRKDIVKCKYCNKNTKFETAVYCLLLFFSELYISRFSQEKLKNQYAGYLIGAGGQ